MDENSTLRHSYLQEQSSESVHVDSLLVELGAGATYSNALLQSGDLAGLTEYFKKNHRLRTEAHRKRAELERRIAADPFDIEAQRELEDQIRQKPDQRHATLGRCKTNCTGTHKD